MKTISDKFVQILNNILSSKLGLLLALVIPLIVIPMNQNIRNIENILSSNWVQLWALFVLGIMSKQNGDHIKKIHTHLNIKDKK